MGRRSHLTHEEARAQVDALLKQLPPILRPRHEWKCEPCGIRMVFLSPNDLDTNRQNHLSSEMHRANTGG